MRKICVLKITPAIPVTIITILFIAACQRITTPIKSQENGTAEQQVLTVMTHDSFDVSEDVVRSFENDNAIKVKFIKSGDTGTAVNKAILSRGNPIADVFYGVDNTFLSRALDEDIFLNYESPGLENIDDKFKLDPSNRALPVNFGDVCLNYDKNYFAEQEIDPPSTLEDLLAPAYRGLLVVENPATSSPGLAFLFTTIAHFSDGKIVEYYGPGLKNLTAMDRHVIANMGAELGATTTVFPSDAAVRKFLKLQEREDVWQDLTADRDAAYDLHDDINLSELEPMIAKPSSPGNVVPVSEVAGREIYQSYIGSSANSGFRDFAIAALIVADRQVVDRVSLDINPTSRQILENLVNLGHLEKLIHAGARIHQPGCNGCIGMGQAPATGKISLRTVPRNFPGRSGTKGDQVYLCSPETAAVSALTGVITDPREFDAPYPEYTEPRSIKINTEMLVPPLTPHERTTIELEKGPNIQPLPDFTPLPETLRGPVLLKMGDNVSTDEIMPAGNRILPFRSNIPEISKFTFSRIDESFYDRAVAFGKKDFLVVGGDNYGQGSSREHAVLGPRYLGLRAVIAKSFARIHWQNLINFGMLPLTFKTPGDWEDIDQEDLLAIDDIRNIIQKGKTLTVINETKKRDYSVEHALSRRQVEMVLQGSLITVIRKKSG